MKVEKKNGQIVITMSVEEARVLPRSIVPLSQQVQDLKNLLLKELSK